MSLGKFSKAQQLRSQNMSNRWKRGIYSNLPNNLRNKLSARGNSIRGPYQVHGLQSNTVSGTESSLWKETSWGGPATWLSKWVGLREVKDRRASSRKCKLCLWATPKCRAQKSNPGPSLSHACLFLFDFWLVHKTMEFVHINECQIMALYRFAFGIT